jgi:hypothetical protein
VPIGTTPESESQIRALASLSADEQREVWKEVTASQKRKATPEGAAHVIVRTIRRDSETSQDESEPLRRMSTRRTETPNAYRALVRGT